MGEAGEGGAGEGAVLADATAVAEQLKQLADNPEFDEKTIDQVMQLIEPAMKVLNSRKKVRCTRPWIACRPHCCLFACLSDYMSD